MPKDNLDLIRDLLRIIDEADAEYQCISTKDGAMCIMHGAVARAYKLTSGVTQ